MGVKGQYRLDAVKLIDRRSTGRPASSDAVAPRARRSVGISGETGATCLPTDQFAVRPLRRLDGTAVKIGPCRRAPPRGPHRFAASHRDTSPPARRAGGRFEAANDLRSSPLSPPMARCRREHHRLSTPPRGWSKSPSWDGSWLTTAAAYRPFGSEVQRGSRLDSATATGAVQ